MLTSISPTKGWVDLRDESITSGCEGTLSQGELVTEGIARGEGNQPIISGGRMTKRQKRDIHGSDRWGRSLYRWLYQAFLPSAWTSMRGAAPEMPSETRQVTKRSQAGWINARPRWTKDCHLIPRGSNNSTPSVCGLQEYNGIVFHVIPDLSVF